MYSVSDVGQIVAGPFGREFCNAGYILYQVCLTGTALVPVAIAFETLSEHAVCNVVWYVIVRISFSARFALTSGAARYVRLRLCSNAGQSVVVDNGRIRVNHGIHRDGVDRGGCARPTCVCSTGWTLGQGNFRIQECDFFASGRSDG